MYHYSLFPTPHPLVHRYIIQTAPVLPGKPADRPEAGGGTVDRDPGGACAFVVRRLRHVVDRPEVGPGHSGDRPEPGNRNRCRRNRGRRRYGWCRRDRGCRGYRGCRRHGGSRSYRRSGSNRWGRSDTWCRCHTWSRSNTGGWGRGSGRNQLGRITEFKIITFAKAPNRLRPVFDRRPFLILSIPLCR